MASPLYRFVVSSYNYDLERVLKRTGLEKNGKVQKYIDSEVLRLCEPFIPYDGGDLIKSGKINTKIGSGEVVYRTPYARRWYYMPANFQQKETSERRGRFWGERMKQKYLLSILRGATKRAKE